MFVYLLSSLSIFASETTSRQRKSTVPRQAHFSVFARIPVRCCPQANWLNKILHGYLKYDLPLWLTEFACGDDANKMTESHQASYLADALKLLELHPAVARYAW